MPSKLLLVLSAVGVAVVAIIAAVTLRPRRGALKPLHQPPDVPPLVKGRSYFWLSHHKTGTNLMQRMCNITAVVATDRLDQCAFCLRMIQPVESKKHLGAGCVPDPEPSHGKLRGTIDRFTLVSSISAHEVRLIRQYFPDFRAVHMIRHPVAMAISAHQYNKFVSSPEGQKWRWDMSAQDIANATSLREELIIEAKAIIWPIREMFGAHELLKNDSRALTLDLDHDFEETFNATTERLFRHMFDDASADVGRFVGWSAFHDKRRWDAKRKMLESVASVRFRMDRSHVLEEWKKLEAEGNPDVVEVTSYAEKLGYPHDWTPVKDST